MDLVDRTLQEIRERKARLAGAVSEYQQLLEADRLLSDAFGPVRRAYRRQRTSTPQTIAERVRSNVKASQEIRLNVQTLTHNPKEFEDREVAHVTQEPA